MRISDYNDVLGSYDQEENDARDPEAVRRRYEGDTHSSHRHSRDEEDRLEYRLWRERRRRRRRRLRNFFLLLLLVICVAMYLRYFRPFKTDVTADGYISSLDNHGVVFMTTEGQLILDEALGDTTHIYGRDFIFSINSDSLAVEATTARNAHRHVRITYDEYYGSLPWRGASTRIVKDVAAIP